MSEYVDKLNRAFEAYSLRGNQEDCEATREAQIETARLKARRAMVCPQCGGAGTATGEHYSPSGDLTDCPICHGTGEVMEEGS